eukprot:jgi/Mesvir1/25513/Mv01763-RA.1
MNASDAKHALFHCNYCQRDISSVVRVKCAACADFDLCVDCFSIGVELGPHKNDHPYHVVENLHMPLFDIEWGLDEELLLLEGVEAYGLANWTDVAHHVGLKSGRQCCEHYYATYMDVPTVPLPDMSRVIPPSLAKDRKTLQQMLSRQGGTGSTSVRPGMATTAAGASARAGLAAADTAGAAGSSAPPPGSLPPSVRPDVFEDNRTGSAASPGTYVKLEETASVAAGSSMSKASGVGVGRPVGPGDSAMSLGDDPQGGLESETDGGGNNGGKGVAGKGVAAPGVVKMETGSATGAKAKAGGKMVGAADAAAGPGGGASERTVGAQNRAGGGGVGAPGVGAVPGGAPGTGGALDPPSVMRLAGHSADLTGYNAKRNEFDPEYDNEAEVPLAEMEFKDSDTPGERALKVRMLEVYNLRLDERQRRKRFILERGLLNVKRQQALDRRRTKEERELYARLRVFLRFQGTAEHEALAAGLVAERRLRARIDQLKEGGGVPGAGAGAGGGKGGAVGGSNRANRYLNRDKPEEAAQALARTPGGAPAVPPGGVTREVQKLKGAATPGASVGGLAGTPVAGGGAAGGVPAGGGVKAPRGGKGVPGEGGGTSLAPPSSSSAPLFDASYLPGVDFLSAKERALCTGQRITPVQLLTIKDRLLHAHLAKGGVMTLDEAMQLMLASGTQAGGSAEGCAGAAPSVGQLSPTEQARIATVFEFMVESGWIVGTLGAGGGTWGEVSAGGDGGKDGNPVDSGNSDRDGSAAQDGDGAAGVGGAMEGEPERALSQGDWPEKGARTKKPRQ